MYTFGVRYLCVNPTRLFQLKAESVHNSKETGRGETDTNGTEKARESDKTKNSFNMGCG